MPQQERPQPLTVLFMILRETSGYNVATSALVPLRGLCQNKPFFTRFQNELAAKLTTISPEQAGSDAGPLLKILIASTATRESDEDLLPLNRAMFVLRHVLRWISEDKSTIQDENLPDVLALATLLLPTLQGTLGSHWDSLVDLASVVAQVRKHKFQLHGIA